MKNVIITIALFCSLHIMGQDVIVKKDGSTILSKVLEINPSDIKYKKFSNPNGPTYTIEKSEVMSVNYENGDKDTFNTQTSPKSSQQNEESSVSMRPITEKDKASNRAALESWAMKPMPPFEGKGKDKKPNILYCALRPTHDSYIADANLELSFKGSPLQSPSWDNYIGSNIIVIVKNKTSKTVYLDLGNTFIIRGNSFQPYYIPSASSSTDGTHSGVGVNLGSVAGAFGLGGSFGQIANGITVSSGTSKYNSTIFFSQRVIAIPPMSSKSLQGQTIIPPHGEEYSEYFIMKDIRRHRYSSQTAPHIENIVGPSSIGSTKDFQEGDIPFKSGIILTYSFNEDIESPHALYANFYIRQMTGIPNNHGTFFEAMPKNFSDRQINDIFILLWQDK